MTELHGQPVHAPGNSEQPAHEGPGQEGPGQEQPYDLVVTGVRLVSGDGVVAGGLAVSSGRIACLLGPRERPPARRTLDGGGRHLLPGLIDSHVHFRTPGLTHKEDWAHAGRAAVAGGVTTVIDMPNTLPPLHTAEEAHRKAELLAGTTLVDHRFHLGVTGDDPSPLRSVGPREATSVKVFLAGHHTAPDVVRDPAQLEKVFRTAAEAGLRLLLHAEDDAVFGLLDSWRGAPAGYGGYERHRPRSGGIVAVARVVELVRRHGTAVHVLHVSSAEEADLLTAAAHTGLPVTFEVTPHHLSFTATETSRTGARARLSPALRDRSDRERLWQAVVGGEVATLGSDHAPHTRAEKLRPPAEAPPGLPGVQEMLTAVHTGLRRRAPEDSPDAQLSCLARLLAERPAGLFGLDERKGRLRPGLDADFVLFDADERWMLAPGAIQSKCGWSAYEGWTMTGRVLRTVRRGETVYSHADGQAEFGSPDGRWLDARRPGDLVPR
ncbi:dihydroorotase [Streptacidiphilus jiangxiensis]|uniref:Dihydroorotase n=1 Tax=Streptacidiphilus jiangxiensis TaxID=235985 RepID=A0A1H7KPZ6_STRJI|nr:dihydroorotase family protein [Streptacidiphilus jiangxiensis]SEK88849.1 dihydroorotase [Streptacidiphilus jiangxiensis]